MLFGCFASLQLFQSIINIIAVVYLHDEIIWDENYLENHLNYGICFGYVYAWVSVCISYVWICNAHDSQFFHNQRLKFGFSVFRSLAQFTTVEKSLLWPNQFDYCIELGDGNECWLIDWIDRQVYPVKKVKATEYVQLQWNKFWWICPITPSNFSMLRSFLPSLSVLLCVGCKTFHLSIFHSYIFYRNMNNDKLYWINVDERLFTK